MPSIVGGTALEGTGHVSHLESHVALCWLKQTLTFSSFYVLWGFY